jgi:hypothetical protein
MPVLVPEKRDYQRLLHTEQEEKLLKNKGFESVFSSNVSAVATQDDDLIIRFHGGATYGYKDKASKYNQIIAAASKGKWVWRFLIRPKVPYYKMGSVNIPDDVESRDMMVKERKSVPLASVDTIVPLDFMTTGKLPTIFINPIASTIGKDNSLALLASIIGT